MTTRLTKIGSRAFYLSTFTGTLDVSNVTYIQEDVFYNSRFTKVIRGAVQMADVTSSVNNYGINPKAIRLANGNFYNGSNVN